MSARAVALATVALTVALVVAQDVAPAWSGFHAWQYAATLGLAAVILVGYAAGGWKGEDGTRGRRLVVAVIGALVVNAAGIASGLLGPDTQTVEEAPGTVAPLPDVGAAAFFPVADAGAIARGDARVVLRRRNAPDVEIRPGRRQFVGATAIGSVPAVVAFMEARDERGRRLTITQPANPAFLSPVLFFPQQVSIANKLLPADAFATPAVRRRVKAFYFSKDAATAARAHGVSGEAAVLFAVDDDAGKLVAGAIGFTRSGVEVSLGGVRLLPTLGTYPTLQISAVPYPPALWFGAALIVVGLIVAFSVPEVPDNGRVRTVTLAESPMPERRAPTG